MTAAPHPPTLVHQGLVYGSDDEFLSATAPFCADGLERGDAVLAVTTAANAALLARALGESAGRVEFVDAEDWYRAPGRTLSAYHRYVDRHAVKGPHPRVRVIGEPVWHGRDELETAEWTRYESVINLAFADCPAWIVCPYDTRVLPGHVVDDARRTHPQLAVGRSARASDHYTGPTAADGSWERRLAPLRADGEEAVLRFGTDLSAVRAFVARTAAALGMSGEAVARLVYSVNELATNAVRHGGGGGQVTLRRVGPRVICDVTDPGAGPVDWYQGYLPPDPGLRRGCGLWLVRQFCDLLEVDHRAGRTTVRLHADLG
ncbi:anti-sigma factor RsbA family regulatory protein [Saccharothrix sp. Mg75]|uniref:anti-sigma factor RsbA family regulatory protein n=1 Tax=Saccharothrix sp. Mg75 TaxID=3445357 RepID=UPI003EE9BCB0